MMHINDEFSAVRYNYGWELHRTMQGEDKDGNEKDKIVVSYHPNLSFLLKAVIDKSVGDCSKLEDVIGRIDKVVAQFNKSVGGIKNA